MVFLIKPFVTDKSSFFKEKENCYTFSVPIHWNKIQIKKKIGEMFGFSVNRIKNVRTMIYPKKNKSKYTKKGLLYGKINKIKKVIIQLSEDQKIDFLNSKKNSNVS
ncbi:50S ribosomal protein L23 [Blattabacterium cuenoti]|uniref:50S ribosomal protein L23 n=1 Tax=Blattabacterium cuenoti TaxID=1653831 RepID=UPI00163C5049|nr:50S ribosomal protein L23 [Blattabacterium cuenoti]